MYLKKILKSLCPLLSLRLGAFNASRGNFEGEGDILAVLCSLVLVSLESDGKLIDLVLTRFAFGHSKHR